MTYEQALVTFAERKVVEDFASRKHMQLVRILDVKVDYEEGFTDDTYWGTESSKTTVQVQIEYDHTMLRSGETKRKIGWSSFVYENPVDLLKDILNDTVS